MDVVVSAREQEVHFSITIAQNNHVYWERWRPTSGFIRPDSTSSNNYQYPIINAIFDDDHNKQAQAFIGKCVLLFLNATISHLSIDAGLMFIDSLHRIDG